RHEPRPRGDRRRLHLPVGQRQRMASRKALKMTTQPPTMQIDTIVVEENEPDECFTVGMAEGEEGRQLIIQTALYEPDDQDRQLGLDSYCVIDENGATYYGGIEEALLTGTTLTLTFTEEAT